MSIQILNKNKTLMVLLVQSIIFIFLVFVFDLILWAFSPVSLDNRMVESLLTQDLPGLKSTIVYKSGKYGLRSLSEIDDVKPNNLISILCLGASTTNQPTQETQDTWCGILETKLQEYYGHSDLKFQTMAFGVGGFRASNDALWIQETFDKIKPDIVITLLGINDLAWNGGIDYKYSSINEIFSKKRDSSIIKWLKKYSQIFRRVVFIKEKLMTKIMLKTGGFVEWHSSNLPDLRGKYQNYPYIENLIRNPDPINEFRDTISWIATFLKQKKVQVIMLGQPVLWKESFDPIEFNRLWFSVSTPKGPVRPSGAWLKREMARYNFVQQSIASQSAISYINLDDNIPKTLDYYFDDCHFTDLGSMAVADNILPVLINVVDNLLVNKGLEKP
ncbi:MAG: SGNH/GDSL hydrolase family protein [Thermodesulfovibrionia bacterium]|nr:SGNH/GDSL hydrolase family protein [Thermodesulfovibrionia bacterium]